MTLDSKYTTNWQTLTGETLENDSEPGLVFTHVSDLHGQLTPRYHVYYDNPKSRPDFEFEGEDKVVKRAGGIPILTAKLNEIRSSLDSSLTLMSGDTFHGTAVATYADGRELCDLISDHLKPDIYVPGNWDVADEGSSDGALQEYLNSLEATILANNLYEDGTTDLLYEPYTIFERNGITVGVVGMTNGYVDRMSPALYDGKYEFGKHPALLEESAREAREDGADLVVAVTEIGLQWMVQAAKDCPSIDVAFSAHTHEYTHEPIVVNGTLVLESGMGDALGRLDVRRIDDDEGGDDTEFAFRHVLYCLAIDHEYTPELDSAALEAVDRVRDPYVGDEVSASQGHGTLERSLGTVVGETETLLARRSFLTNTWNTAFLDALVDHTGADLGVVNGYRFGFAVPPGEITLADCYGAYPMTSPIATGDAYGKQLANHMEAYLIDNFSPHIYGQEDGRLRSYSSNVSVTIDPTAKRERRLVSFRLDGEPIDPDATYTVATLKEPGTAERELGGCNFPFRNISIEERTTAVDVLVTHLEDGSPLQVNTDGLVTTSEDGGKVQNTPADGSYPFVQPGVDYADGDAYCETRMIPIGYRTPEESINRRR